MARSTRAIVCAALIAFSGLGFAGAVRSERGQAGPTQIEPRLIDLNSASLGELELLPRIGPALAQRIADDRAANGPYEDLEDLARVSGIGPKTVARLQGKATVSTPAATE